MKARHVWLTLPAALVMLTQPGPLHSGRAAGAVPDRSLVSTHSDGDGDGIDDQLDRCPGTPPGIRVNPFGCPLFPCPARVESSTYLGTQDFSDEIARVVPTSDGGCIAAGRRYSHSGQWDYWTFRLDAQGQTLWEQDYGGSGNDQLFDMQPLPDGSYLLGGASNSPGGEPRKRSACYGLDDFWVVAIDAGGHPLWERSYGGSDYDFIKRIDVAPDGGAFLAGCSASPPGGTKTSPGQGSFDYWVARIDASGGVLWDQSYGTAGREWLAVCTATADGGALLAGTSDAAPDVFKTTPAFGKDDAWVLRIDANGAVAWQRSFGGTETDWISDAMELDGGDFLLCGDSGSPPGPGKTTPCYGSCDGWLLRLDSSGSLIVEDSIGGAGIDWFSAVTRTVGDHVQIVGGSQSPAGGNKTSPLLGVQDCWLLRFDAGAARLWEQSIALDGPSLPSDIVAQADGRLLLAVGVFRHSADACVLRIAAESGDCDGDGVANEADACPSTAPGAAVDAEGCSAEQRDADQDGVVDAFDRCPGTDQDAVVDAHGCAIDQLCPCEAPWSGHWDYVRCVLREAWRFYRAEWITARQRHAAVMQAVCSQCGVRQQPHGWPCRLRPVAQHRVDLDRIGFRFLLEGEPGGDYLIEASSDLQTWTPLGSRHLADAQEEILDPAGAAAPRRFYRVRPLP